MIIASIADAPSNEMHSNLGYTKSLIWNNLFVVSVVGTYHFYVTKNSRRQIMQLQQHNENDFEWIIVGK